MRTPGRQSRTAAARLAGTRAANRFRPRRHQRTHPRHESLMTCAASGTRSSSSACTCGSRCARRSFICSIRPGPELGHRRDSNRRSVPSQRSAWPNRLPQDAPVYRQPSLRRWYRSAADATPQPIVEAIVVRWHGTRSRGASSGTERLAQSRLRRPVGQGLERGSRGPIRRCRRYLCLMDPP